MASINADNGAVSGITGVRTTADNTGNLSLQANGVTLLTVNTANTVSISGATTFANTVTVTGALTATGGVIQGANAAPAFSAYMSSNLDVTSGTITKVPCNTKEFDTASCYDNTTNYRFTPNVAGYYQVTCQVYYNTNASNPSSFYNLIYKNGAAVKSNFLYGTTSIFLGQAILTALVYMNGSTDYIEFYARSSGGTSTFFAGGSTNTFFQAFLARSA
jgi:hypothetical protein